MSMSMSIANNIHSIVSQLPKHVTLIAVSKTKPNNLIEEAYATGHREFGENYVQELTAKYESLPKDIHWHFIGHLQSNKVKYIAPFIHLIHGIDSYSLLEEVNKQGQKHNRIINCLLQLYIAKEETKFGLDFNEATEIIERLSLNPLPHVCIKGFMAMASNTDDEAIIKNEFKSLKTFANKYPQFPILSFGMSSDYHIAIEEGSTMVRIGSSIFGNRDYLSSNN